MKEKGYNSKYTVSQPKCPGCADKMPLLTKLSKWEESFPYPSYHQMHKYIQRRTVNGLDSFNCVHKLNGKWVIVADKFYEFLKSIDAS
jgi:hypothetical protein